jgi:hypothetical protein
MKVKSIIILLIAGLLLSSSLLVACQKQPGPSPGINPNPPKKAPVPPKTPEQLFQEAIAQYKPMIDAANVVDEKAMADDPGFKAVMSIAEKLKTTAFADLKPEDLMGAQKLGPFPGIKPGDVHPKIAELLTDVQAGQTSKVLYAPGQGFAMIFVQARDDTAGTVDMGVILYPVPPPATPAETKPATGGPTGVAGAPGSTGTAGGK